MREMQAFRENVIKDLAIIHQNHKELLEGLNASEFNLRAHQKVLNAMSLEHEQIVVLLETVGGDLNRLTDPEDSKYKTVSLSTLQMATVPLPQEDGSTKEVRRINWPYYHQQVEKDLKLLAEHEEQVKKQEEEEKRLARKAAAEAEAAEKEAKEEAPAAEEAQQEPPQDEPQEGEFPEGAQIFGG